jgi:3'-5' exoribonuclease
MPAPIHPEKGPYLRDLQSGQRFVGFYAVRSRYLEPFRDASRGFYLTLVLSDASGQLIARVWEDAQTIAGEIDEGQVVKLEGEVDVYLDRTQIRVVRIRPARAGEYDRRDFLPSGKRDPQEMLAELSAYRDLIAEPHLLALVDEFYTDKAFLDAFADAPATPQVHHAYLGGLLEHTLNVLQVCATVLTLYPALDAGLLIAAAFLYQVGKVRELRWEMDLDYSDEGRLIGDILLSDEMVAAAIRHQPDFPAELALRLRHCIAAQNGRYEWGSPRQPQTLEAIALHQIEDLDSQINRFAALLETRPPADLWTAYDRQLGRSLYGPPASQNPDRATSKSTSQPANSNSAGDIP